MEIWEKYLIITFRFCHLCRWAVAGMEEGTFPLACVPSDASAPRVSLSATNQHLLLVSGEPGLFAPGEHLAHSPHTMKWGATARRIRGGGILLVCGHHSGFLGQALGGALKWHVVTGIQDAGTWDVGDSPCQCVGVQMLS